MLEAQKVMTLSEERGHRKASWGARAVMGTATEGRGEAVAMQERRLDPGGCTDSQKWTGGDRRVGGWF